MKTIREAIGAEAGDHPTYEMLRDVVDRSAGDVTREIVESHCQVCATCAEELRDLRAFADAAPASAAWPRYAGIAAAIALVFAGWRYVIPSVVEGPGRAVARRPTHPGPSTPLGMTQSKYGRDDWDAAVLDALARGTVEVPRQQWPVADPLRGSNQASAPEMSPTDVVIDSTTPVLTWPATPGRCIVTIYDGSTRVAQSPSLQSSPWQVSPPLARGRTYVWQVEIRRGGTIELLPAPPAPPAMFQVLDETSSASLAEARRRFPNDHLLLGVLSARCGLQRQAAEELRMYGMQHPEDREVVIR